MKKIKPSPLPKMHPNVKGFIQGQLEALRGSLGQCIRLVEAHNLAESREALLEATYAVNRASNAIAPE